MNDESINFSEENINSVFYYKYDTCVGSYMPGKDCGRRYQIITSSEASGTLYVTKTEMMAKLDKLGVKYTWLKYTEHEN
jgi:hypothetical protein